MINKLKIFVVLFISTITLSLSADLFRTNRRNERHELDDREVKNENSPDYLNAIGSLGYVNDKYKVKSRKFQNIECGASLVSIEKNKDSNLIITASHCVLDNIKKYTWTTYDSKNEKVFRKGKLLFNDTDNDIALIKLTRRVSYKQISPLIISNDYKSLEEGHFAVAGFSVDSLGEYGKYLTYDETPNFITLGNEKKKNGEIGSITYQGDSGGAIIYNDKENNTQYLVGIMSFIAKNKTLFENEIGKFGNISGYFVDLINYESIYKNLLSFISKKIV